MALEGVHYCRYYACPHLLQDEQPILDELQMHQSSAVLPFCIWQRDSMHWREYVLQNLNTSMSPQGLITRDFVNPHIAPIG
jgi:hypothetical protein